LRSVLLDDPQGGFGSNIGPEGGEHHEHAAALAVELQAETSRLQDEVYKLQESLVEAEEKAKALRSTLHMFRCPSVNEAHKFHSEVVFPVHLYAATAFAKVRTKRAPLPVDFDSLSWCMRDVKEVHTAVRGTASIGCVEKGGGWTNESEVSSPSLRRISSMSGWWC